MRTSRLREPSTRSTTRCLVAVLTAVFACACNSASAQDDAKRMQTVRAAGVTFMLPDRFLPEPLEDANRKAATQAAPTVDQSFVDGDTPAVHVVVSHAPLDGVAALRELPTRSGALPEAFARGYVEGLERTKKGTTVTAGAYDAERHAFSARILGRAASPARLLSIQPPDSPAWKDMASSGGDLARTRCVLDQLLAEGDGFDEEQARERYPRVADKCQVSVANVEAYVRAQPRKFFMGARTTSLAINYLMPKSMTVIMVIGPPAQTSELERLVSSIWTSAKMAASSENEPSRAARLLAFSDVQTARLLGVVFGALVAGSALMALFGWLLIKLRAPVLIALIVPAALLLGLVVFDMTTSATPSAYMTGKLLAYTLGAALLLRPMQRWLRARQPA